MWIDVTDSSGARYGDGHRYSYGLDQHSHLDRGHVSFTMPAATRSSCGRTAGRGLLRCIDGAVATWARV